MKLLLLSALSITALLCQSGRSLVIAPATNGSIACNAVFTSGQDARLEISISNFTYPTGSNLKVYTNNCVKFRMQAQPTSFQFDANGIDGIGGGGSPCSISPPAGQGPYIFRVQRFVATNTMTCEVHKWDSTGYLSGSVPYTSFSNGSSGGSSFGPNTTDATFTMNEDFVAIYTTTVPLGMFNPAPTTSALGDNTNLTFDNTLLDSTSHHNDITLSSPTYATTPNLLSVAFLRTMGAPSWTNWISIRAGQCNSSTSQMDGSSSYSMAPSSSTVTYFWQQLSGPTTIQWSNRLSPQPFLCNIIFGGYRVQLTVRDINGSISTSFLDFGATSQDNNGTVINSNPLINEIIGPQVAFGKNPWGYIDFADQQLESYWASQLDINGGTWALESSLTSVGGVPRTGTIYVANGDNVVHGIGTNFGAVFCGSGITSCTVSGLPYVVPHWDAGLGIGTPYTALPRLVGTVQSDTQLTLDIPGGWLWPQASIISPGVSWGTYGLCSCGDWRYANRAQSNLNYYDLGQAHQSFYYASGYTSARDAGRWYQRWIQSPELGFQGAPRDLDLVGLELLATLDSTVTNLWPNIRSSITNTCNTGLDAPFVKNPMDDVRETSYCTLYLADQAILDTGSNKTAAQTELVTVYNNIWSSQITGNTYINNEAGSVGNGGTGSLNVISLSNGSTTGTRITGPSFTSSICNDDHLVTNAGSIVISSDRLTLTGSGTSFSGTIGDRIYLRGTFNGQPWSQLDVILSTGSSTNIVLGEKWRGDYPVTISAFKIVNNSFAEQGAFGFYEFYFSKTDSVGTNIDPPIVDQDNWYWCSVVDGDHLSFDKPYTGNTSTGNIYRFITYQNLTGRGSEPFMIGITALAMYNSSTALVGFDNVTSAHYRSLGDTLAQWLYTNRDPISNGSLYGATNFSNCQSLSLTYIFPSQECAGTYIAQGRTFAAEQMSAIGQLYNSTGMLSDKNNMDAFFTSLYAAPGYNSPFVGDGNFADILLCCNISTTLTKGYGQAKSIGQMRRWAVDRLGGRITPNLKTISVNVKFPYSISNTDHIKCTFYFPSSQLESVTSSNGACSISDADLVQGSQYLYKIEYINSSNTTLSSPNPQLITVQ